MIYVIGSGERFRVWCEENSVSPRARHVRHLSRAESTDGVRPLIGDHVVRVGGLEARDERRVEGFWFIAGTRTGVTKLPERMTIDVDACARCGGDHINLEFEKLERPIDGELAWWAPCPRNGQPILLSVEVDS